MKATETAANLNLEERLKAYLVRLDELKEANTLREIMEERIFHEFLRVNRERLNEYPLLEIEQRSIIDILLKRAPDHPGFAYMNGLLSGFFLTLNKYGKAAATGAADTARALSAEIAEAETVLVKAVQGAVYATALCKDNFSDVIIRHFGEGALTRIEEFTHSLPFDDTYWKAYVESFIKEQVALAYDQAIAGGRYRLRRESSFLVLRFSFDEVLASLTGTEKAIQKTRVQTYFEDSGGDPASQKAAALVAALLAGGRNPVAEARPSPAEMRHLARIVSIDPVAATYVEDSAPPPPPDPLGGEDPARPAVDPDIRETRLRRLREQLTAMAVGAAMANAVVKADFVKALKEFNPREVEVIRGLVGDFEAERLELALHLVLELYFVHLLQEKGAAEGGKIQVRTLRARRAALDKVEALAGDGLSRIRRKQIFDPDPDNPAELLFKARSYEEFSGQLEFLQLPPELREALTGLWRRESFKIDFLALINLTVLGKVTTNLSLRLAEILARYGITQLPRG